METLDIFKKALQTGLNGLHAYGLSLEAPRADNCKFARKEDETILEYCFKLLDNNLSIYLIDRENGERAVKLNALIIDATIKELLFTNLGFIELYAEVFSGTGDQYSNADFVQFVAYNEVLFG